MLYPYCTMCSHPFVRSSSLAAFLYLRVQVIEPEHERVVSTYCHMIMYAEMGSNDKQYM